MAKYYGLYAILPCKWRIQHNFIDILYLSKFQSLILLHGALFLRIPDKLFSYFKINKLDTTLPLFKISDIILFILSMEKDFKNYIFHNQIWGAKNVIKKKNQKNEVKLSSINKNDHILVKGKVI